jgi:hypothetical protein
MAWSFSTIYIPAVRYIFCWFCHPEPVEGQKPTKGFPLPSGLFNFPFLYPKTTLAKSIQILSKD